MVAVIEAPEHQTLLMQQTFRAVLTALSEPLRAVSIPALPTPSWDNLCALGDGSHTLGSRCQCVVA